MNSDMNDEIFSFILKVFLCLKACIVSYLKQDLCKLRYIHNVNMPLQSMTNGFQSEVRLAHAVDYLSILNSCF